MLARRVLPSVASHELEDLNGIQGRAFAQVITYYPQGQTALV
jgi:hypothetical protein